MADPNKEQTDQKADEKREDKILRRMLNTPPKPHKPIGKYRDSKAALKPRYKKGRGAR